MKPTLDTIEQFLEPFDEDAEDLKSINTEPIVSRSQVIDAVNEVSHIITQNGLVDDFHPPRLLVKDTS